MFNIKKKKPRSLATFLTLSYINTIFPQQSIVIEFKIQPSKFPSFQIHSNLINSQKICSVFYVCANSNIFCFAQHTRLHITIASQSLFKHITFLHQQFSFFSSLNVYCLRTIAHKFLLSVK